MTNGNEGKLAEMLDIYDERMNRIGTAARSEAHAQGLWHQTFQCWVLTSEGGVPALLFQQRHPDKDTFPGLLDISSAGHLLAGETPENGVRELEEELGLQVSFEELIPCGVFPEEDMIAADCIDREFCHVYLYRCNQPVLDYRVQPDEVTGLFRATVDDVKALISGAVSHIPMTGFERNEGGQREPTAKSVSLAELTPHSSSYYALLFAALDLQ